MSCQQYELYGAERSIVEHLHLPRLTLREAQAAVDGWREFPWWQARFANLRYVVIHRLSHGASGSVGGLSDDPRIAICEMHPAHMNELFLCHEVSHPLAQTRYGNGAHSPWFARTYLELVYLAMGSDVYKLLVDAFIDHDIDFHIDE